jgi:catechol 2,3-dioxygenase-like lactoylglutathione lyase family enzyme
MSASIDRRQFLAAMPALAMAPRLFAQAAGNAPFRVNGLSAIALTVSDVARSLDFYQGLFGMPVQARQGSTILLRIGSGPRFLALRPAAAGERPSISALGFGVQDFSVDRAMQTLAAHGFTAAPPDARKPGPRQALVRVRRQDEGGSPDGSTRDLFAADPSGVVFQLHDVSYCGGSGPLGNVCPMPERSARPGLMALSDTSHFTIAASDPTTVPMYLDLFGFKPMVYQAATPAWQVGNGVHFLMFIGGGGPTRGNAAGPPGTGAAGAGRAAGPAPIPGAGAGPAGAGRTGARVRDRPCLRGDGELRSRRRDEAARRLRPEAAGWAGAFSARHVHIAPDAEPRRRRRGNSGVVLHRSGRTRDPDSGREVLRRRWAAGRGLSSAAIRLRYVCRYVR